MTEYERGFIDGVRSKVTAELTPVITKMAGGLNQTIQEAVKTVIGNVKITAHEPASVKRGNWNNGHCSSCGEDIASRLDTWTNVQSFKFCPNCGADMRNE